MNLDEKVAKVGEQLRNIAAHDDAPIEDVKGALAACKLMCDKAAEVVEKNRIIRADRENARRRAAHVDMERARAEAHAAHAAQE